MKKLLFLFTLIVATCLMSCSDGKDELSSGTIEDLCEEKLEEMKCSQVYTEIDTGYYEMNYKSARDILAKLKAASVIDYEVKRYAWYNKDISTKRVRTGSRPIYYYGIYLYSEDTYATKTVTEYNLEEHFLVKVSLNKKGMKAAVDSIPQREDKVDKDLKPIEVVLADYPENQISLKENWPELTYPGKPSKTIKKATSKAKKKENKSSEKEDDDYIGKNTIDKNTVAKYKAERKKLYEGTAYLKAFKISVKKARNIIINKSEQGVCATAEAIAEIEDVTDFGRILDSVYEDSKFSFPVELIYYEDKGWQLIGDIHLSKASKPAVKIIKKDKTPGETSDSLVDEAECDTVAIDTSY